MVGITNIKKIDIFCYKSFFSYIGTHTYLHSCTQSSISFIYGHGICTLAIVGTMALHNAGISTGIPK